MHRSPASSPSSASFSSAVPSGRVGLAAAGALAAAALALSALLVPSAATAAAAASDPAPASAPAAALTPESSDGTVQERIDEVLDAHGGVQTGWNEVSWDGGDVVLTIDPDPGAAAGGLGGTAGHRSTAGSAAAAKDDCAAGRYCAYAGAFYGGNKLTYSSCPATQTSFSLIGSVRSIKNNRTSGTVRAYNGGTVKATLGPGAGNSNISGITKITCS